MGQINFSSVKRQKTEKDKQLTTNEAAFDTQSVKDFSRYSSIMS